MQPTPQPLHTYPPYTFFSLPAFHYFHTNFIETQPQAQVRSVPILTPAAVSGPQMADYNFLCTPETLKILQPAGHFGFTVSFLFFRLFWLLVFFRQFHFCHCSAVIVVVVVAVVVVSAAAAPSLQRPHCKLSRPPPNLLGWHTTRQRLCSVDVAVVVAVVVCCRFSFVVVIFVL